MSEPIATRDAYGKALAELGAQNPNIVVLDADLSKSTKTALFGERFPERFFNMGIAEQNMIGVAAGLAAAGKIPFASTFAVFAPGRVFDQIRNSIAYADLNVKIAASHAGLTVGADGASHQAVEDIALVRAIPHMTVIVPADGEQARQAVFAAAQHHGPVYLRLGRPKVPVVYDQEHRFQIGRADQLRTGDDVAIIACGLMVSLALQAADQLAAEGIAASVINMATIKPLDIGAVVRAAKTCGAVVTAEEHNIIGGLGSAVAEALGEFYPVPLRRVGIQDQFGQSGEPDELLAHYGMTAEHIAMAAREAVARKV